MLGPSYLSGVLGLGWRHDQTTEYNSTSLPNCPTMWDHLSIRNNMGPDDRPDSVIADFGDGHIDAAWTARS